MLRLDYSRFLFLTSYLICLFWFGVIQFSVLQTVKTKLAVIPGGNSLELLKIDDVSWTVLSSTELYEPKYGAIVADLRSEFPPKWERFIAERALQGISVFHSKQVQEMLTGKVDIEHLSENNFGSLLPQMDYLRFRQVIDIVVTIIFSPIILATMAVVGIVILVTSGKPVFFRQERVGYRGELFTAYKFRSMANDVTNDSGSSDDSSDKSSKNGSDTRKMAMTVNDDKRITRFGSFLRKYRIDELPQAINILKGQMSWVGPRPEALALSLWYQEELPFYSYRHVVRPGITGWAQVNQGHVTRADQVLEKLHYDFFYIKHLSAWLDILIVLRTIKVVFFGIGAK
jgi:lipopolysaccharide/colanic/teichoic acid biosynthesis glycosyltransferase